jgi:hypothetical protein
MAAVEENLFGETAPADGEPYGRHSTGILPSHVHSKFSHKADYGQGTLQMYVPTQLSTGLWTVGGPGISARISALESAFFRAQLDEMCIQICLRIAPADVRFRKNWLPSRACDGASGFR